METDLKTLPELPRETRVLELMMAPSAVARYGQSLVGRLVLTAQYGDWPGGVARVVELRPDPTCPDILFEVEHPEHGRIGVLENEEVGVLHL